MKTHIYKSVSLCLLLSLFGALTCAEPRLNGLAPHQDLGKERFIAALYADNLAENPAALMSSGERRRMELRITTNRYSARRLNRMWIEGMAINNSGTALTEHAQNMVDFTNMVNKKLMAGDILTIEGVPGEGTHVSVNGVKLGTVEDEEFFTMLLRTWIGPVPLSSDFRDALLRAGNIDNSLLARYQATTPSAERVAAVEAWLAPAKPPEPEKTEEVASATVPEPGIPTLAPTPPVTAPPVNKPQLAASEPAPAEKTAPAAATPEPEPEPEPDTEQEPQPSANPKPVEVAMADTILDEGILDEDDLDEEEDAPLLTAESLLSRQLYHSKLLKWTYQYLKYPQRAQKRGQQGSVRLAVVINRSGRIQKVSVEEESRYALLNKEARGAVDRASPFPPMPAEMSGETFSFSLPIVFRIK